MLRIFLLITTLALMGLAFACNQPKTAAPAGSSGDSPTESYKRLFAAVKAKDIDAIKAQMSKKSIEFGKMAAERNGKPGDTIFENGFTETTFADSLPEIRDERIKDDMGAVEVWNLKSSKWEDLGFVKEDGSWKLAVGDMFAGTYVSPGKGRDAKEKEAANLLAGTPAAATNSGNANAIPITRPVNAPPEMKKAK